MLLIPGKLSKQAQVVKTKSTECMTFAMCFANFVVSFLWTTYGHLIDDNFVKVSDFSC